jgi:hypothetical protein
MSAPREYTLTTTFDTNSPSLRVLLRQVQEEKDPIVKLEIEAVLHHWVAVDNIRRAERMRHERDTAAS